MLDTVFETLHQPLEPGHKSLEPSPSYFLKTLLQRDLQPDSLSLVVVLNDKTNLRQCSLVHYLSLYLWDRVVVNQGDDDYAWKQATDEERAVELIIPVDAEIPVVSGEADLHVDASLLWRVGKGA